MYNREAVEESVSVYTFSNAQTKKSGPFALRWRGRKYKIIKVGTHHTVRRGRTLLHIYSVTDGSMYFKLAYDTDNLDWKLLEVASE